LTARGERRISGNGEEADRLTRFGDAVADRLMAAPIRRRTGGRLRKVMCGGAPLDPGLVSFFFGLNIPLYEGYGLSETSAILCLTPPERARGGSVGPPCSSTELRLVGGGGDEPGEIQVKGPQVFSEYESDPESTAAAFTADGWFRTGDLGSRDEDGFVRIRGRTKHVLLTSWGKMVTPGPMEARFTTSPLIEHAVVVGEGRPYLGLLVDPNTANLAEAARKHGISGLPAPDEADATTLAGVPGVLELLWEVIEAKQADLSKPERVRSFRVLPAPLTIDDGALTATMKIRRRVVLERYAELIEAVFAGEVPD
jgi:long-chain acyl-CoA synthetase